MDKKTSAANRLKRTSYSANSHGPLRGLRVIDLSRLVAGNMLTLQLADFGADVIKVEPRNGDTLRAFKTRDVETFWKVYCRNKRSVCLDFRHERAIGLLRKMIDRADVLVESFRPGVLEQMGLAPDMLRRTNPKLVVVRISGWGQSGPYNRRPGFGTLVEGYSGFAAMNGFQDREPVLPPMFLGDMTAGLYGASATMTALWEVRINGGQGQDIDLSLFEPMISILGPQAASYRITGKVKARTGSRSSTTAPRNTYKTADGQWVCVSTSTQTMAARLFCAIGRADMNADPRYSTNVARLEHVQEVDAVVSEFVGQRTLAENLQIFEAAEVTVGPIYDASHLLHDDYVIARESLIDVEDADLDYMPMHNVVPRLSTTPGTLRRPAPRKGQHTAECLTELLSDTDLQPLFDQGVIFGEASIANKTEASVPSVSALPQTA